MRVGIVTDGQGEVEAHPKLLAGLQPEGVTTAGIAYADLQPKASPGQIVKAAESRIRIFRAKGTAAVVLAIDLEDRRECAGQFARSLEAAFAARGMDCVRVAVKHRCLENWLLADVGALRSLAARFRVPKILSRKISPNKADHVQRPVELLQRMAVRKSYHKRRDPPDIMAAQDASVVARNSRSFRRFLRLLGHRAYREQSRQPA